jgi:hypothetical protein
MLVPIVSALANVEGMFDLWHVALSAANPARRNATQIGVTGRAYDAQPDSTPPNELPNLDPHHGP